MGKIVGAIGMSHIMFPPDGVEDQAERVLQYMLDIRRRFRAMRPDVLILAGADHLNNFNLAMQVGLAIGIADSFHTLGDGGVPPSEFPGHREFAEGFARYVAKRDFELVQVEEVVPDHGTSFPKLVLDPDNSIPTIPLFVNAAMPVPPEPGRCYRLGELLAAYVEECRPKVERVAVVGTGGLSHWLRLPGQGNVAEEFDQKCLKKLEGGNGASIASMSSEEIVAEAGNGGLEIIAWLLAAGSLSGAKGQKIYYEAIPEWVTGMGAVEIFAEARD